MCASDDEVIVKSCDSVDILDSYGTEYLGCDAL
jgi:hypothetical protein